MGVACLVLHVRPPHGVLQTTQSSFAAWCNFCCHPLMRICPTTSPEAHCGDLALLGPCQLFARREQNLKGWGKRGRGQRQLPSVVRTAELG